MDLDMLTYRLLPEDALEWIVTVFTGLVFFTFFFVVAVAAAAPTFIALLGPASIAIALMLFLNWITS